VRDQRVRSADVHALQAAGALPRVDRRGEQGTRARRLLLHRVEEGARACHREASQRLHECVDGGAEARVVGDERGGGRRDGGGEALRVPLLTERDTDGVGQFGQACPQGGAVGVLGVALPDAGAQHVLEGDDGVGDRRIGADQGALHAPGAQAGVEHGDGPAEEALVLARRGARRHEQSGPRQDRSLADRPLAEGLDHHALVVVRVEQSGAARAPGRRGTHGPRQRDGAETHGRDVVGDRTDLLGVVVHLPGDGGAVPDDGHVRLDDGLALAPELLDDLLAHLLQDVLAGGAGGDPVDVCRHGADERDSHHAGLELRGGGVLLRHREGVDDEEADPLLPDRAPRLAGQLAPDLLRGERGLQHEGATVRESLERVGVREDLVIRGDDDLHVLQLGVGDLHRFRAERDVVVGRRTALLGAVLRGGLGVHAQHAREDVREQLAGGDGAVASHGVEADPHGRLRQEPRVRLGGERHELRLGVGGPQARLDVRHGRGRVVVEELGAEVHERREVPGSHPPVGGDEVAGLQVVAAQAEDRRREGGAGVHPGNPGVALGGGVLPRLEQGLRDEVRQRHLIGALEDHHGLLAGERRGQLRLGEGLQQLDGHQADLETLAAEVRKHGLHVLGHGSQPDHHVLGVLAQHRPHRGVLAAGQLGVLAHRLPHEVRHCGGEVGPVVGGPRLEVRLVLDGARHAGVVDVHEGGDHLPRPLLVGVDPLAAPLPPERLGHPAHGLFDEVALVVPLDVVGVRRQEVVQRHEIGLRKLRLARREVRLELEHAALRPEQEFLGDRRARDATRRIPEVLAEQFGLGEARLTHHVARREAVHGVGDGDQRERGGAVGDGGEVGRLLRVGPEQHGVAGREERVDVVVPCHHVQRVLGDHTRGDLQDEATDLLAHRDEVGLHRVQDALAGGGVGDELPARQRRAQGTALRRVLTLGFEEERVPAPDVDPALGTCCLVQFRDLGRRRDRVADHAPAHVPHDVGDGTVAVDHVGNAGVLGLLRRHGACQSHSGAPGPFRSGRGTREGTGVTRSWSGVQRGGRNTPNVIDFAHLQCWGIRRQANSQALGRSVTLVPPRSWPVGIGGIVLPARSPVVWAAWLNPG